MTRPARYRDQYRLDKQRRFVRKLIFILAIIVIFISSIIYLLFFAKLLDVRSVDVGSDNNKSELVDSTKLLTEQWLKQKKYFIQRRGNILFLDILQLEKKIENSHSKIDSADVRRNLPHGLAIQITERLPIGIWCLSIQNSCFYVDKDDILYENAPKTSGFLVLSIKDERPQELKLGDKITPPSWLQAISLARQKLIDKGLKINEVVIPPDSIGDFYALTSGNWKVLFNLDTDIKSQINAMTAFMSQKLTPDKITKLKYLDLRIQDRIYYK